MLFVVCDDIFHQGALHFVLQNCRQAKARLESQSSVSVDGDNSQVTDGIEFYNANIAGLAEERRQLIGMFFFQ
jgi:hypothetical protein